MLSSRHQLFLLCITIIGFDACRNHSFNDCRSLASLSQGEPFEAQLRLQQSPCLTLRLDPGDFLEIAISQPGADLAIRLIDPRKQVASESDFWLKGTIPETLWHVAAVGGTHRIEVAPAEESDQPVELSAIEFDLRVLRRESASDTDRLRHQGLQSFLTAERHRLADGAGEAIEHYGRAAGAWEAAGETLQQALSFKVRSIARIELGQIRERIEDSRVAGLLFSSIGEYREASERFLYVGFAYLNRLDSLDEASHFAQLALDEASQGGNPRDVAQARSLMGSIALRRSQHEDALIHAQEAVKVLTSNRSPEPAEMERWELALAHRELGNINRFLWRLPEAKSQLTKALRLFETLEVETAQAYSRIDLGWVHHMLEEYEPAARQVSQGIAILEELAPDGVAGHYESLGSVYLGMGRLPEAQASFRLALKTLRPDLDSNADAKRAYALTGLCETEAEFGRLEEATRYCTQSLEVSSQIERLRFAQAAARVVRAGIYRRRGKLEESESDFSHSIEILEALGAETVTPTLRAAFFGHNKRYGRYYEGYIRILMDLHWKRLDKDYDIRAFELFERTRARTLRRRIIEKLAGLWDAAPESLLGEYHRVRTAIVDLNDHWPPTGMNPGSPVDPILRRQQEKLNDELVAIQAEIRLGNPVLKQLEEPKALGLKEIQQRVLDEDSLLLAYSLGEERSYLWVVSHDDIHSFQLPAKSEIESLARRYHGSLSRHGRLTDPSRCSRMLGEVLLGPAASLLDSQVLYIVADGALGNVAFSALIKPSADGDAAHRQSLAVSHETVRLPSGSSLAQLRSRRERRRPSSMELAVLADPVLNSDDPRLPRSQSGSSFDDLGIDPAETAIERIGLSRLRFSGLEAETILAMAPAGQSIGALGLQATREFAASSGLSDFRIIHFATHGLVDPYDSRLTGLALCMIDHNGRRRNGILRALQISGLELSADLVVLSACETALGQQIRGEGFVGLVQAFLEAGASGVIASLWPVDDQGTSVFMEHFYENLLQEGQDKASPARSLQKARMTMMNSERWSHPHYWAGFVLIGDNPQTPWREETHPLP